MSAATVRVGVAGWDYRDWNGVLYPKPKPRGFDTLRFLAGVVDVIEINSSFYGPPRPGTAERWLERTRDHRQFRFTAKLWRRFTHERKAPWTAADEREVRDGLDPLLASGRLGALLAQFPWSFRRDEAAREWLGDIRQAFAEYPLVIEVRHASWNEPEFFAWLAENGVGFVNVDQPLFARSLKPSARATSRVGYVRVHGRNYRDWFRKGAGRDARYDYLYEPDELRPWVARTREVARAADVRDVDVIFNNHYRAQAVVNALQFKSLLTRRAVVAPPLLSEHYAPALAAAGVRTAASPPAPAAASRSARGRPPRGPR